MEDQNDERPTTATAPRELSNTDTAAAKTNGWAVDKGNPDAWELIVKAHNAELGMMKSTKRMKVDGGYLYCVTTEVNRHDGKLAISEAIAFVSVAAKKSAAPKKAPAKTKKTKPNKR